MGVLIPILCGYVTLPLYALVTQVDIPTSISCGFPPSSLTQIQLF